MDKASTSDTCERLDDAGEEEEEQGEDAAGEVMSGEVGEVGAEEGGRRQRSGG